MAKKEYWRINSQIRGPEVRVLDEKGEMLGVMPIAKALEQAKKAGLDLVEVAPKAKPPVVKIIDFGKFKYQEEKKKQKSKAKKPDIKEVRFSPFIGEADYETRMKRVREFLGTGDKIRVVVKFKGRQMGAKKFGYNLMDRLLDGVGRDSVNVDMEPKFIGRHLSMVISPKSGYVKKQGKQGKKK